MFLAFLLMRSPNIQAFHAAVRSHDALWRACGFRNPAGGGWPSYPTVRRQFVRLESFVGDPADPSGTPDGFLAAARHLIIEARTHPPKIGRVVHVDGTAVATHAALIHCCPPDSDCAKRAKARADRRSGKPPHALPHGSRLPAATTDTFIAEHHKEDAQAADIDDQPAASPTTPSQAKPKPVDRDLNRLDAAEIAAKQLPRNFIWWRQTQDDGQEHYFCCADPSAGARLYSGTGQRKFWTGWLRHVVTDAFTGAPLGVHYYSADRQEYHEYPELMTRVYRNVGHWPQAMTGDRGLAVKDVYLWNSRHAIGSVMPWRQTRQHTDRGDLESEHVDRHGVPRCKHCGAEAITHRSSLGFRVKAGKPVIEFECAAKLDPECRGVQTIACEVEPRLLQPLRLDDKVWAQLNQRHANREGVHISDRQRHNNAGRDVATRDRRLGVPWQLLRAHGAMLLDWLRLHLRNGWMTVRAATNTNQPRIADDGGWHREILKARQRYSLHLPYGPKAVKFFGSLDPPWKRFEERREKAKARRAALKTGLPVPA